MARLKLITPPAVEPISLAEARMHLKLTATGSPETHPEDALVRSLITAVRLHLDGQAGRLGRCLVPQTWEYQLDTFPRNEIRLPLPPLIGVLSIKYDDPDAVEQTISASDYTVDGDDAMGPAWIIPLASVGWPTTLVSVNTVRIRFTAGYPGGSPEDGSGVPEPIRQAMLLMLGHLYEHRGAVESPGWPAAAMALISPYEFVSLV